MKTIVLAKKIFYVPSHIFHALSWISAMDIDDAEDLEMAKAKACFLSKKHI